MYIYIVMGFIVAFVAFIYGRGSHNNNNNNDIYNENIMTNTSDNALEMNEIYDVDYTECDVNNWLNRNGTLTGYHVLCIENIDNISMKISYYKDGIESNKHEYISNAESMTKLRRELESKLSISRTDENRSKLKKKDRYVKWAMYHTKKINKLTPGYVNFGDNKDVLYGLVLIYEGGNFIYPPIEVGFERNIKFRNEDINTKISNPYLYVKLTTLSVHPIVIELDGFLDYKHCDYIINLSERHMKTSTVSHMHNTQGNSNKWRTSETHWLKNNDKIINIISKHTAEVTRIPLNHQEHVQVLRYNTNGQYDSHWDYFDPKLYKGTNMESKIRGGKNRLLTLFWYMSTVNEGGFTYFPRSGKLNDPKSYKLKKIQDCNVGLKVKPIKGNVILFYSMKPDGGFDPYSLHGACPVGENQTKWGANKWIWSKPVHFP